MPDRGFLQRLLDRFRRPDRADGRPDVGSRPSPLAERGDRPMAFVPPAVASPRVSVGPTPVAADPRVHRSQSAALDAFIATVRQLPLFSSTAMQLMRSVGDEATGVGDLVRLISTDAGLVAHLLRIVNSPFYGLPQRVSTVGDAVAVLGFDQIRRTVSAAVLKRPLMSYLHDTTAARIFWRHELLCAAVARQLALRTGADGEIAYMAGLMHEIGRLAMLIEHPELGDLLLRVATGKDSLGIDREIAHFGFDHAAAGGALLEKWGLPMPIVQAAYDHGAETVPADAISAAVWRANLVAHHWTDEEAGEAGGDGEAPWIAELGLTPTIREGLLAELAALEADQP